ncbi:MAG: FAD-binding protein, partial [Actinomycetota bacterium]|nr:FAD-binding protein [Actinomycetota bacterium]
MRLAEELARVVGEAHVLLDDDVRAPYETDWTRRFSGRAAAVVRPASAEEVASALRVCAHHGATVIPQGGNTGLVGGAT